jgi:hypothetical protein
MKLYRGAAMALRYKFQQAERILARMGPAERGAIVQICREIRQSQKTLLANARDLMQRCLHSCEGICCRNVDVDAVIGTMDFVFLLAMAPQLRHTAAACLEADPPWTTADCVFLADGRGPCLFPDATRPEVCVCTFCDDDRAVRRDIRRVKRKFFKLWWLVQRLRLRLVRERVQRAWVAVRAPGRR